MLLSFSCFSAWHRHRAFSNAATAPLLRRRVEISQELRQKKDEQQQSQTRQPDSGGTGVRVVSGDGKAYRCPGKCLPVTCVEDSVRKVIETEKIQCPRRVRRNQNTKGEAEWVYQYIYLNLYIYVRGSPNLCDKNRRKQLSAVEMTVTIVELTGSNWAGEHGTLEYGKRAL